MLRLTLQYFDHLMWRANSLKNTRCWERLRAEGEGDDRGWDGWMASLTQQTWVWATPERQWRTRKPGVMQSMGFERVGHNQATEQQVHLTREAQRMTGRAGRSEPAFQEQSTHAVPICTLMSCPYTLCGQKLINWDVFSNQECNPKETCFTSGEGCGSFPTLNWSSIPIALESIWIWLFWVTFLESIIIGMFLFVIQLQPKFHNHTMI